MKPLPILPLVMFRFPDVLRSISALLFTVSLFGHPAEATAVADTVVDGVPLPANASPATKEQTQSDFAGTWVGKWGGWLKTILVVEAVDDDGSARVIYAVAEVSEADLDPVWFRLDAKIDDDTMIVNGNGFKVSYTLTASGSLEADFDDGRIFAVMSRRSLDVLTAPQPTFRWDAGIQEFLSTELLENGEPVKLEAIIFKPTGDGPFPLAIVNHGSTGRGDDASAFRYTWVDPWLARQLTDMGYLVAFPQRRGRGKSDGLYDEGFGADRQAGYTCDSQRSLAGADRALADISAAMATLRDRPDVRETPVLLVGHSRGGILSIAYAGQHAEQVAGVINFVGGWIGDLCPTAEIINQTLFKTGGGFQKGTLWLYGQDDPYYSMAHSRKNFETFVEAGGSGRFVELTVPGDNGHRVLSSPTLWERPVASYLDNLDR